MSNVALDYELGKTFQMLVEFDVDYSCSPGEVTQVESHEIVQHAFIALHDVVITRISSYTATGGIAYEIKGEDMEAGWLEFLTDIIWGMVENDLDAGGPLNEYLLNERD